MIHTRVSIPLVFRLRSTSHDYHHRFAHGCRSDRMDQRVPVPGPRCGHRGSRDLRRHAGLQREDDPQARVPHAYADHADRAADAASEAGAVPDPPVLHPLPRRPDQHGVQDPGYRQGDQGLRSARDPAHPDAPVDQHHDLRTRHVGVLPQHALLRDPHGEHQWRVLPRY